MTRIAVISDAAASTTGLAGLVTMAFVDTRLGAALFASAVVLLAVRPAVGLMRGKRRHT